VQDYLPNGQLPVSMKVKLGITLKVALIMSAVDKFTALTIKQASVLFLYCNFFIDKKIIFDKQGNISNITYRSRPSFLFEIVFACQKTNYGELPFEFLGNLRNIEKNTIHC
jgi:hypothetical protein